MAVDLLAVGQLFAVVAVAGAVAARLDLSVVPLYVLAGMLSGPAVAGRLALPAVAASDAVTLLAELGIVLLLFFLGLEFSLDRLLAARARIVRAGVIDLAVNFPLGVGLGLAFGWSPVAAFLLGGVVYISSSAIVTKSLVDLGWIANPESEAMLGVLVFEDVVVAVYLAVVGALVLGGEGTSGADLALAVGAALAFLGALVVAVRVGDDLLETLLDVDGNEAFVLRVLGVAVPVAGAALAVGASEAVAAFFVGTGFAATDHAERIERLLSPLRDVFAAAFFFWIGAVTDPLSVAVVAVPLAATLAVTMPAKAASGYLGGRQFGLSHRRSVRAGTGLVARGEFSLVIAATAAAGTGRVLTDLLPALAVGYVVVTSLAGTLLMERADWVAGLAGPGTRSE